MTDDVIAAYYRLSRDEDTSASIETQRRAVRAWLDANGYQGCEVVEYIDSGVSGAKPLEQRKDMHRLMQSRPTLIVAWKLDRYARSVSEFLRLVAWCSAHGSQLVTTDNTINTTSATGRMVAVVLAALAEWEREMIRSRILDGHATRRSQGRWVAGQPPYGYEIERREDGAYLAINEAEAAKIRAGVLELIDPNGKASVKSTAHHVDVSEMQWRRLLKSPTLRGYRNHKGKLECGPDGVTPVKFAEPIISAAEHKAIKARLAALSNGQTRAPRRAENMCSGMVWCTLGCDKPMHGGKSNAGARIYRCKSGHMAHVADVLDQRVTDEFLTRWGDFEEHVVRLEGGNDLSDQMAEAQEQAERIAARMASAGPLMLTSLEKHAEELEAAYAALRAAHDPEVREVLEPTGRTLRDAWEDETARTRLLRDMGLHVTVRPGIRGHMTDRLSVSWAIGGDDHEAAEILGDLEAARR
jgi:DNA invertase Pin-like site-specific DNA recombinase